MPPQAPDARARARQLRVEAELANDRTEKAALLYEAGYVHEIMLHQPAQAAQDYLAAYNVDNRSRLPLHALVRMFERRRSYKNLARLYDAELRSARTPAERATALTDHAVLALLAHDDLSAMQARLEQALEHEPKAEAAILLEWQRRAAHDDEGALRALEKRAESCDDGAQRAALLVDLALLRETRGDVASALEALRAAAVATEPAEELYAIELARFARQHGFPHELAEAHERRAARLALELTQPSEGRAVDPLLLDSLAARAIAHYYESARLRCVSLADPLGALRSLESALALAPDHLSLKQLRMLAYDLLEDRQRAADEACALLALGVEGELAAALHFRLAERALVAGEMDEAREKLRDTIAAAGGSAAAEALLDDLLLDDGRDEERVAQRERATYATRADAVEAFGEAAHIAAHVLGDRERALSLFTRAAEFGGGEELLREAYGSAIDGADETLARFALDQLLTLELEPDERAALVHHRYELGDAADRLALVDAELARAADGKLTDGEIPALALVQAAQARDHARLGQLHETLARSTSDGDLARAELCAAARAFLRAGNLERARKLLVEVLEQAPAQRYALTLLEEVLRSEGDAAGAIAVLRQAASQHESARETELHLLSAGLAAEQSGDLARAAESYREAAASLAGKQEGSHGALWALYQLARKSGDRAAERRAREALVARERARGRAAVETVLLAEQLDLGENDATAAQALLVPALGDEDVGHHAAVALALSRGAGVEQREQALELLATRATDSLRPALLRELGGELVAHGARAARVLELAERVSYVRPDDRWAIWTRTHARSAHGEDDAAPLETLASITTDAQVADAARAEALWLRKLATPELPLGDALDALPPSPVELGSDLGAELAATIAQLASPADDRALRAQALDRLARDAYPEHRAEALLTLARAQLANDDDANAISTLEELLNLAPESLAGWELAYVAARSRNHTGLLADAAERLARALDGDEALALLEEAADIRIDQLDDLPGAETLLREALALEPSRRHAYARLHECIERRGDQEGLIALVRSRVPLVDEPEALLKLYYELARLERKRGNLDGAFAAVDHALMLDDDHVGALALLAEIHTARSDFAAAVSALDRLGTATSLPAAQRRVALLGAADFLENRLGDRAAALTRLEQLAAREPQDAKLQLRIADLCERAARDEGREDAERRHVLTRAAEALGRAVELEPESARAELLLRRGALLERELGRHEEAAEAYRRTLELSPERLAAARAYFGLTGDRTLLHKTESVLRAQASADPRAIAPLEALLELAEIGADRELAFVAGSALAALGRAHDVTHTRKRPTGALDASTREELLAPPLDGAEERLARAVFANAAALDALEPARFGVGRGQRLNAKAAHPLLDELRALCATLGLTLGDVYVGGSEPQAVVILPDNRSVGFVVGASIATPLSGPALHAAALQVAAAQLDTLPLLTRGAREGARLLWAALASEELALPAAVRRADLAELPRAVGKALPRRVRKSLHELAQALPEHGARLEVHCQQALDRTRRLALLLSAELSAAVEEAGRESDPATDLLRAWVGPSMRTARQQLGLAT